MRKRDIVRKTLVSDGRTFHIGDKVFGTYLRRSGGSSKTNSVTGVVTSFNWEREEVGVQQDGRVNLTWCKPEDLNILESTDAGSVAC